MARQADGKIVVGGNFTNLAGQSRDYIGRLNSDGSLDTTFYPGADGPVYTVAIQADGKIVVGGDFTTLAGASRIGIGRLNTDGTIDNAFNPDANNLVYSLGIRTDGKILIGGQFTSLGGQTRNYIGRLNSDGSLDTSFNAGADDRVTALALQPDGKIVLGGDFTTLGGMSRVRLGRLSNDSGIHQELKAEENGRSIQWIRNGGGPEINQAIFEISSDLATWTKLGKATRIIGGWQLKNQNLPFKELSYIRARGSYSSGFFTGSGSEVESTRQIYITSKKLHWPMFLPAMVGHGSH
jgi:uncharacterized delta-60 repeat protein